VLTARVEANRLSVWSEWIDQTRDHGSPSVRLRVTHCSLFPSEKGRAKRLDSTTVTTFPSDALFTRLRHPT